MAFPSRHFFFTFSLLSFLMQPVLSADVAVSVTSLRFKRPGMTERNRRQFADQTFILIRTEDGFVLREQNGTCTPIEPYNVDPFLMGLSESDLEKYLEKGNLIRVVRSQIDDGIALEKWGEVKGGCRVKTVLGVVAAVACCYGLAWCWKQKSKRRPQTTFAEGFANKWMQLEKMSRERREEGIRRWRAKYPDGRFPEG